MEAHECNKISAGVPVEFGIKDCFIMAFPDGPANCRKTEVISSLPVRQPFPNPLLILFTISRGIFCSKALPDQSPNAFGHQTLKKEMVDCFWLVTKFTGWIPRPSSPDHVVFG